MAILEMAPSDASVEFKNEVTPSKQIDAAKPLSARKRNLCEQWLEHLVEAGGRMPSWMRAEFRALFWEEQEQLHREGKPLSIPTCPEWFFADRDEPAP